MTEETTWELEPHTRAKHEILVAYLKAWYPILGRWRGRVLFVDGFAGPGVYAGGQPGSPILALDTLLGHTALESLNCEFLFWFIEADANRFASLEAQLARLIDARPGGLPSNVKIRTTQSSFADAAADLVAVAEEQKKKLAPTLALVDPFGFSGVPIELIAELVSFPQCEVIFNFMFDWVNRFATAGNVDRHFEELFGCADFMNAPPSGRERHNFLRDLYDRQLHEVAGFKYTRHFEMINRTGHTGNYLFFGTRHRTGLERMKTAMWKVDPEQGSRFSDQDDGKLTLFGSEPDLGVLRRLLLDRFAGNRVTIDQLEEYVAVETDFLHDSHLKRRTLVPMEKAGEIVKVEGRKKSGYPPGSVITFAAVDESLRAR